MSVLPYSFIYKDRVACSPCSRSLPLGGGASPCVFLTFPSLTLLVWLPMILQEEQSQDLDQLLEPQVRLISTLSHFPEECTYDLLRLRVKAPSLVKSLL